MNPGERFHTLDNLRGIIMWLGVVLHVAANHLHENSPLPLRDRETTQLADFIVVWIHVYRMPLFFTLAGFFAAMLESRYGLSYMLKHRFKRIALPFLAFWPPLFILISILAMAFVHLMETGAIGLNPDLMPDPEGGRARISTLHLWFIYYLMWLCVLALPVYWLTEKLSPSIKQQCLNLYGVLATRWWGFAVLALPLAVIGAFYSNGVLKAPSSFIPDPRALLHYGLFFFFGWLFFSNREKLFQQYQRYTWHFTAAGFLAFFGFVVTVRLAREGALSTLHANVIGAYVFNCATWLWSFAILGLFLRYLSDHNKVMLYISDSSYWVYLVHMLGTIGFGVLLYNTEFSAITKMLINITLTTAFGLATYHWFVRFTFIGKFLNGRKHPRKKPSGMTKTSSTV